MKEETLPRLKFENERKANLEESQDKEIVTAMPVRVNLNTNNDCNIKCNMCGFSARLDVSQRIEKVRMNFDMLVKVADELFPAAWEIIPTTRGEPLLYDNFEELVGLVGKYCCRLGLYTNGILLDEDFSRMIIPYINDLKVSFDGATKSTYETLRTGSKYEKVIENIHIFNSLRDNYRYTPPPTVTIQYTLMRSNIEELPSAVKLAAELGADRIAASHVYIFYPSQKSESLYFHQNLSDNQLNKAFRVANKLGLRVFFPRLFSGNHTTMPHLFDSGTCSYLYKETWIEPNGDIHPCFMPDSPVMGKLNKQSFKEIWNGASYRRMRMTVNSEKPSFSRCLNCPIRMQFDPSYQRGYQEEGFMFYDANGVTE